MQSENNDKQRSSDRSRGSACRGDRNNLQNRIVKLIINYNETCIISNMITEKELHSLGFFKLDDTQVYINPAHSPLIVLFQNGIGFIPHIFSNTENVFKPCKMILEIFELEELLHS